MWFIKLLASALCIVGVCGAILSEEQAGYNNLDFEKGTEGWRVWYSDDPHSTRPKYPYSADSERKHSGKQCLKVVGTDPEGCAFVHQTAELKPGTRHLMTYWYRPDGIDEKNFTILFNFREKLPDGGSGPMKACRPPVFRVTEQGGWKQRICRFRTPPKPSTAQVGIYLKDTVGTVWVDDIKVRKIPPEEDKLADMWEYDPWRVELGSVPEKKFRELVEDKAPILKNAQSYNWALVHSAFAKDELQRLARTAHYAAAYGIRTDLSSLGARCQEMENRLASLYRLYGQAYLDQENEALSSSVAKAAERLERDIAGLRADTLKSIRTLQDKVSGKGVKWLGQPEPLDAGLPGISPDGKPNQLIFGTRSLWNHGYMEEPLGINSLHSTTVLWPRSDRPGEYDWTPYFDQWKEIRESDAEVKRSCLLVGFVLHDSSFCPKWMDARIAKDPELLLQTYSGAKLSTRRRHNRKQLNWWHPEIKAFAREVLTDMSRTMKPHEEFLFYEFQWECYGPYVGVDGAPYRMEPGYSSYAKKDFRSSLQEKYGDIAGLNRAWGTEYQEFSTIEPPPDKFVVERKQATPLSAEWEKWREDSYVEWCKLIYKTLKESDGTKSVLAGHSQLFDWINAARAYETCDMLGFHRSARWFMPGTLYINSISRYNGYKPLGQYENFWGIQEHHDRMTEELPQRHNLQKHIFRLTVWGRLLQIWWYAYTSADYLTHYDGNWFDPVYALTTLRYRVGALPVYHQKFKRAERVLLNSHIVPSRICFLQPSASMRNQYPYKATVKELYSWFDLLFPRNYLFEIVPEEYFLDGRANVNDFDVLILPYAIYLPRALQAKLEPWLRNGKRLLVSAGPFALYDEVARKTGGTFTKLMNVPIPVSEESEVGEWCWKLPSGENRIESRTGESRVIAFLTPSRVVLEDAAAQNEMLTMIDSFTRRSAFSEKDFFEMVLRQAGDARYLFVTNPDVDHAHEDIVKVEGEFKQAEDIDIEGAFPLAVEAKGGRTKFGLRLEPCEVAIVRLHQ